MEKGIGTGRMPSDIIKILNEKNYTPYAHILIAPNIIQLFFVAYSLMSAYANRLRFFN